MPMDLKGVLLRNFTDGASRTSFLIPSMWMYSSNSLR